MKAHNALIIKRGQRFGWLVILKEVEKRGYLRRFLCKCDCGNEKKVYLGHLCNGHTKSCGCFNMQQTKKRFLIHGMRETRFYSIWSGLKTRCLNKNNPDYKNYYGRHGITVCKEWLNFGNFKKTMYKDYLKHIKQYGEKNTQIDRKDNNRNYCKDNCHWVTCKKQQRNRCNNRLIIYKGKTKTIAEWAEILKIGEGTLRYRLDANWPIKKIFNQKRRKNVK